MVTKRSGPALDTSNTNQHAQLPYPISPTGQPHTSEPTSSVYSPDLATSSGFDLIDMGEARNKRRDSDVSSHGTWDTDDEEEQEKPVEVPKPLRITPSKQNLGEQAKRDEIPAILKPGSSQLSMPGASDNMDQYAKQAMANPWADDATKLTPQSTGRSNNPYLQPQFTGGGQVRAEQSAWSDAQSGRPPIPAGLLPPQAPQTQSKPPIPQIPSPPAAPQTQPPPPPQAIPPPTPMSPVELPTVSTPTHELSRLSLGTANGAAGSATPLRISQTVSRKPLSPTHQSTAADTASAEPWQQGSPPTAQQKWGDEELYAPPPGPPPSFTPPANLIDHEDSPPQPSRTQPPAISTTQANAATGRVPETPRTIERRQRNETYQIKHVNWQDTSRGSAAMRRSPILTQNANGPCPLLALVNALVLTTAADANTALIETLSTREQISLGFLLDAVFDELTSGRRGDAATALPDVSELYRFLLALHTGMNVNPRFVSSGAAAPGFEPTREMKFYSTFSIPLIHGWLPPRGSPAYEAFDRRAQSFEEAQNIQFAESELEDKLRAQGLANEEQQILQDIQTIKHFLNTWPTQLTDHGLEVISATLRPGHFAILFRNDHFSTIYKEPTHGALMTLVTDSGYSSHDEIVWESLVDVNGAASEMFSGDFRTVSHDTDARLNQSSSAGGEEGWQTVPNRNRQSRPAANAEVSPPLPGPRPNAAPAAVTASSTEQEDHDFALALQLQEEEDNRQRNEERRRQEQRLSEQFISGQNEGRPPAIPPRRGGSRQSTSQRPAVNRPADALDGPDAPPSYEQSASDRPFRENGGQSSTLNTYDALRRQEQTAYAAQSGNASSVNLAHGRRTSYGNRFGRRTSQAGGMPGAYDGRRPGQAATAQDAEERCSIM